MIPHGIELTCAGCHRTPSDLPEYSNPAREEGVTTEVYVWQEEGTLNRETGLFLCDPCYIRKGMPATPQGWTP